MRRRQPPARPTSWIGRLAELWPNASVAQPALFLAALVFLVGLGLAAAGDFVREYVSAPQIWVLVFETAWLFGWGLWATGQFRVMPGNLAPAFRSHPNADREQERTVAYETMSRTWLRRILASVPPLLAGAAIFAYVV